MCAIGRGAFRVGVGAVDVCAVDAVDVVVAVGVGAVCSFGVVVGVGAVGAVGVSLLSFSAQSVRSVQLPMRFAVLLFALWCPCAALCCLVAHCTVKFGVMPYAAYFLAHTMH